jgi:DNA-binding response OmpR family regulator
MLDTTVLVLAKDRFVAALLGALVELSGHTAEFPRDGESSAVAAREMHADLILLDCALGATNCQAVSRASHEAGTRVLMFSAAHTEREATDIAHRYGTNAFALPVSPREFSGHLDRALGVELPATSEA